LFPEKYTSLNPLKITYQEMHDSNENKNSWESH